MGLTISMEIAKGTLLNTQTSIHTTTHNVANADNKAYARQRTVQQTNPAYFTHAGWLGMGARITNVVQDRDVYVEERLMQSISGDKGYKSLASHLALAEAAFPDSGSENISGDLGKFWSSWDTLIQDTQSLSGQTGVYQATQNLADSIRTTYNNLNTLVSTSSTVSNNIPTEISDKVGHANELLTQIAKINHDIIASESPRMTANDLRDTRFQLMNELSELLPVQFTENPSGGNDITITSGGSTTTLIHDATAGSLSYDSATETLSYSDYTGATGTMSPATGEIGGLLTAQDDIENYLSRLNTFASSLISQVNTLHNQSGGTPPTTDVFTGSNASDIGANTGFLTGQDPTIESDRALDISNLQSSTVTFGDGKTGRLSEYLSDIRKQMGIDADTATDNADFNETLRGQLEAQQQSVSGVSIDEEMVDLLQLQQIYQAAAKILQQTSSLLDTVIKMV
ncbi:MAG: flagellar hook-associated protein FlgK [Acidobacteriota bacterium]